MTLQELTDTLQSWCHQGHAQDEVEFAVEGGIFDSKTAKLESSPTESKTVCFYITADEQC